MLKLTRTGIGLLTRQYRSVLHKCWLINVGLWVLTATPIVLSSSASADELDRIYLESGAIDTVEGSFSNHTTAPYTYGQGIEMRGGQINYINVDYKNNYFTSSGVLEGGYLMLWKGEIGTITGNYINNTVRTTGSFASSAALFASAKLNSIANAIFKNNQVISSTFGYGGALLFYSDYNSNRTADIGKITADFDSNKVIASGNNLAYGGAISLLNAPQMTSTIDEISGIFSNNGVETNSGSAWGGAISNNTYQDATSQTTNIIHNIYDSTFTGNYAKSESGSASGGAIYNTGTIGISAKNTDTVFRDNKTIVGSSTSYNDVHNMGTLHLNAASGRAIDFGGSITGTGTLNINNGYEGAATGGKYIFRSVLNADQVNLYNGAELQLNSFIQENGDRTAGDFSVSNLTSTGNGNIIALWDGNLSPEHFGNVTLNNNTYLRLEGRVDNSMDFVSASDFHGVGKFIINYIYLHADGVADEKTYAIADSVLKDHIEAVSNVTVLGVYTRNAYDVTYTTDENYGYLTFKKNGSNLYNLAGFLAKDTEGTTYSLTTDENICNVEDGQIGNMAGTNNTKTVNAGDYSIYGNGFAGVLVKAGQSLTINGGVWQDFKNNVVDTSGTSVLTVRDAIFINNIAPDQGGAALDLNLGSTNYIYDSNFINSVGTYTNNGGAIWNRATTTITAQNKDVLFENNTTEGLGGAVYNVAAGGDLVISATGGDVIFKNNTATQGSAIYNAGTLDISAATGHKVKFEGNNIIGNASGISYSYGGAIYNGNPGDNNNIIADFIDNYIATGGYATGGAIANQSGKIGTIKGTFTGNYIESTATDDYYVIGGAISNDGLARTNRIEGTFTDNHATGYRAFGGAIYQYGNSSIGDIVANFLDNYLIANTTYGFGGAIHLGYGSVNSISGTFDGNYVKVLGNTDTSIGKGGAISNENDSSITTLSGTFTDNYVTATTKVAQGGALHNEGTISNLTNSSFSGNYVSGNDDSKGGAIYNEGTIGFSGTNTFTNNKANDVPNDIYNAGTININGGTTTLNSGYIGSETSALTVKSGGTLTANAALEVADGGTLTNESGGTLAVSADNLKIDETTNNGTLELEGGNVTTKLMGTGRMKLMSGNVRLLSSTPPATTGSLSFGSSSDYADSILTSSSAASTSDHALVTAGYLDNNYYMNYGDSMTKSFTKAANDNHKSVILGVCDSQNQRISANDNHKSVIVMSAFKPSSYGKRSATIGSRPNQFAEILVSSTRMTNYFNKQAA